MKITGQMLGKGMMKKGLSSRELSIQKQIPEKRKDEITLAFKDLS